MEVIILIIAHNEEKYIRRAIASVKDQGDDVEIVFVDDSSTDNTAKIAKWALRFSGLKFCIMKNFKVQGLINNARWAFSRISERDCFIIRLDGDDELAPNAIQNLKSKYEPNSFVAGAYLERQDNEDKLITPANIFECLACGVLMRIKDIKNAGGFARKDVGAFIEYDLYARLIDSKYSPIIINDPVYVYYRHPGSITTNKEAINNSLKKLENLWGEKLVSQIRDY